MPELTIRLLGSFKVDIDARPVTNFDSNKVRALLAYLAVECDHAHRREKLAALLWPEIPDNRARANLSQALYNLRHLFERDERHPAYFLVSREMVQFNPASETRVDVHAFKELLGGGGNRQLSRSVAHQDQLSRLSEAVDLYEGEFLEGLSIEDSLPFEEWCTLVRQRLYNQALDALSTLVGAYSRRGELDLALAYARRQVELDPIGERATRQLMVLLERNGNRNQALAQYQRLSLELAEELGIEPERETVELHQRILTGSEVSDQLDGRRHNLPAFLTRMVGRAQELGELQAQLADPDVRLLTILGPGGSGKTRLALEAARANLDAFKHGAFFVSLNPVQATVSILPAVVEAVGLPLSDEGDLQQQLTDYLRGKQILLVMDGFEHLLEGAAPLVDILHQAPDVKVLATSRARLNIKGEQLYNLEGMGYPVDSPAEAEMLGCDAVQLFLSGLERVRQDYQPTADDLRHILEVCRQVEGMPLGILLAASWGSSMRPGEIARETRRGLDFLSAEWSDLPARQRSVRATFEYSWNLLDANERNLFQGLSVFRGGFSRRAARQVLGATPFDLRALVDKSLLLSSSPGRYEMHELMRQFGREKLGESPEVEHGTCQKHGTYYLQRLSRLGEMVKSARQEAALAEIDLDHENYHAAWHWVVRKGDERDLITPLEALCLYYDLRWRSQEGQAACRAGLEGLARFKETTEVIRTRFRMLAWQSHFQHKLGDMEAADQLLEEAQALIDRLEADEKETHKELAFLLYERGDIHFNSDRNVAADYYEHSLEIYRDIGDLWDVAKTLASLGMVAHQTGAFEDGVQRFTECLELHRRIGDPRGIADALIELGQNMIRVGNPEEAEGYIQEGVSILRSIGDLTSVARGYFEMGRVFYWVYGNFVKSYEYFEKSNQIYYELGFRERWMVSRHAIDMFLNQMGKYTEAYDSILNNIALAEEFHLKREIGFGYYNLGIYGLATGDLEQAYMWENKGTKYYQEIGATEFWCNALAVLIFITHAMGRQNEASDYLRLALENTIPIKGVFPMMHITLAGALLLADRGELEKALELAALANRYPYVGNSSWCKDVAGPEIQAIEESLPPEVAAAARERGLKRDIWEAAEELLELFESG